MKYLCIGYFDAERMRALPKLEVDAVMAKCAPHLDVLYRNGHVLFDIGVSEEEKEVRLVSGVLDIGDARPRTSHRKVGGVFLVEGKDIDEAARVASMHPATQVPDGESLGWHIEVRPVHTLELLREIKGP